MLPEMSVKGRRRGTNWYPQEREDADEVRERKWRARMRRSRENMRRVAFGEDLL